MGAWTLSVPPIPDRAFSVPRAEADSARRGHQTGLTLGGGPAFGGLTAQLVMHMLHLGMEGEELVLQIAAALQSLQSSHGLFQVVLAGNEGKTPLGTGFRGHFV